ncbi:hypothetical protein FRC02_004233 [Tulasnella sp. 418]|nr:hypothetical protein FRC02_004233 [Tulasnella sp. 418]
MVSKNEEPVKKRAKTNTKSDAKTSTSKTSVKAKKVPVQRSRVAGRLAVLMNMPVDVFAEICSHLFPIDLLHLSWASKRLRSILMSKSAKHIWRSARENQLPTLPPCPDDLSEPQYIALLFTNICQVCGANRAQRFHFTMRTRHCASCYKNHTVTLKSLVCGTTLDDFDAREAQQFLWAVPGEGGSQGYEYNTLQVEACVKEYHALKSAKLREEYIVTLEQKTTKIRDHAQKVFSWLDEQDRLKIQQEDEISEARWNSIQEKLLELGWEKDDFPSYYNMEWAKLTQKPQALTDKGKLVLVVWYS